MKLPVIILFGRASDLERCKETFALPSFNVSPAHFIASKSADEACGQAEKLLGYETVAYIQVIPGSVHESGVNAEKLRKACPGIEVKYFTQANADFFSALHSRIALAEKQSIPASAA